MNKIFNKIAVAFVGIAMALGVGVGFSTRGETIAARAATVSQIAVYTIATTSSVTSSGVSPTGSNATFETTATTAGQLTYGKDLTLTLTGFDGMTITGLKLSAKSNTSKGAASMSFKSGSNTIAEISSNAAFNSSSWHGSWSTSYVDIEWPSTNHTLTQQIVGTGESLVLYIKNGGTSSSTNSVYIQSISVSYSYDSSAPTISLSSNSGAIKVGADVTSTITYSDLTNALSATSNDTDVATVALANPVSSGDGSVLMTITGVSAGTTTIDVSSSGATTQTYTVTVYEAQEFTKITSATYLVSGGHYLIARTGTKTVMSTSQGTGANNRGYVSVNGANDYSTLETNGTDAAILTLTLGTGTYASKYTIKDSVNDGYYVGSSFKTLKIQNNAAYWSVSFNDNGNAVIESDDASGFSIQYNSSSNMFNCYKTDQVKVDLYLLTSELPSSSNITSFTMPEGTISFENYESYTFTASYLPTNATETVTPSLGATSIGSVSFGSVSMNNGTLTVTLTGVTAGSVVVVLTADTSQTTANKSVTVNPSARIYNSGLLNKNSISTTVGGSNTINEVTWFTNDATMQKDDFTTSTDSTKGLGLGKAAAPVKTFEMTSNLFVGEDYAGNGAHMISEIIVNASVASSGSATLTVKVDGTQVGSTVDLTTNATDYSFKPASNVAGHISISVVNSAEKAVYLGSIIVKGETTDEENELYYSMAKQLEAIDSCNVSQSDWNAFLANENEDFEMTYAEIFEVSETDFKAITLWDHASKDSSSLKTSSFNAYEKFDYINSRFGEVAGARNLFWFNSNDSSSATALIIVLVSISAITLAGGYLLIKRRKEQ